MTHVHTLDDPEFLAMLDPGVDLSELQFYLDYNQPDGPYNIPDAIDFGNGTGPLLPKIKFHMSEATTSSLLNRGTLGGTWTGVNLRPQDIGLETPYRDPNVKAVRFETVLSTIERYYEAPNTTDGDIGTDDVYFEVVFCSMPNAVRNTVFNKRNQSAAGNIGWSIIGGTSVQSTLQTRTTGGGLVPATATITGAAWHHMSGYYDASDTAATGQRVYAGTQSGGTAAHVVGSITNALTARIGAYQNASIVGQDIQIAYLAIWYEPNLWPGGASNDPLATSIIRPRQARMAGLVPQKGGEATTITSLFRYCHRIRNGKRTSYRKGVGFEVTDDHWLADGTALPSVEYASALSLVAGMTPETFSSWTKTNCTLTLDARAVPFNPVFVNTGSALVATSAGVAALDRVTTMAAGVRFSTQILMRAGAANFGYMRMIDTTGNVTGRYAYFDLVNGTVAATGPGVLAAYIQPYEDGWYLCSLWATNTVVDATSALSIGFSTASGSTAVTGDGVTVTGYVYGVHVYSNSSTTPPQVMPITINENVTFPLHVFDGAGVAAPMTLWWEMFSPQSVIAPSTSVTGISYTTDTSNGASLNLATSAANFSPNSVGAVAGATQWSISTVSAAPNSVVSGNLVSIAVAIDTNDIQLYGPSNANLGTDTAATAPASQSFVRVGNASNAAVGGRNIIHRRVAILNGRRRSSNPPRRHGQITGLSNMLTLNEAAAPLKNFITGVDATTSGTVTPGAAGLAGRAVTLGGGYIDTDIAPPPNPNQFTWMVRATPLAMGASSTDRQILMDQKMTTNTLGYGLLLGFDGSTTNLPYLFSSAGTMFADVGNVIAAGVGQDLAVTWDGVTVSLYVGGVLQAATQALANVFSATTVNMRLGSSSRSGSAFGASNVKIEKARVFNYCLSQAEIAALL